MTSSSLTRRPVTAAARSTCWAGPGSRSILATSSSVSPAGSLEPPAEAASSSSA